MSEICAKHLVSDGVETYVTNRTKEKAELFANECKTKIYDFGKLDKAVNEFDIIFSATSASYPIITDDMVEEVDFKRYWFDLALPRDINISPKKDIEVYIIDDIKTIIDKNKSQREQYVRQAHSIVGRSVVAFFEWLDTLNVEPIIKEIYQKAYEAAEIETNRVIKKGFIPKQYQKQLQKATQQTLKRFLHDMTKKMREASVEAKSDTITGALQYMLNKEQDNIPDQYKQEAKNL
jgi:glutamyl-tRNA reductase